VSDRGVLVIVSSPSGAGKTTLTRRLLAEFNGADRPGGLVFSVSYTTRPIRPGEVDGRDYHFVTPEKFEEMVRAGAFAEHAFVFQNRYGTAMAPIEDALARGKDVIFDVDWQGGAALSARWPNDALKIFILPPDLTTLESRLRSRATDAPDVVARRLGKAREELEHFGEYQHLIVNDEVERAYEILRAIYLTRRYGAVDRPELGYPLSKLAKIVEANRASGAEAHARSLVSGRVAHVSPATNSAGRLETIDADLCMGHARVMRGLRVLILGLVLVAVTGCARTFKGEAVQPNPLAHPTETLRESEKITIVTGDMELAAPASANEDYQSMSGGAETTSIR
jgi:guanylate kinase